VFNTPNFTSIREDREDSRRLEKTKKTALLIFPQNLSLNTSDYFDLVENNACNLYVTVLLYKNDKNKKGNKMNKAFEQALTEMDDISIQSVENILIPMYLNDVTSRIKSIKGQFFSVDFARKTDKKVNGIITEEAGSIRHMICRRGVAKYVKGTQPQGQRTQEDKQHDVLTVWDVGTYQTLRTQGLEQEQAGNKAYRRINLNDVRAISIAPAFNSPETPETITQEKTRTKSKVLTETIEDRENAKEDLELME